jgi:membrane associated rhomboid family serine protease
MVPQAGAGTFLVVDGDGAVRSILMATEGAVFRPIPPPPPPPPPPPVVLYALIALNVAVCLFWWLAEHSASERLAQIAVDNLLVSRAHLAAGYWWTLLTAEFSHRETWHLAMNMLVLYSFGRVLVWRWGTRTFLVFYLVAAVVASLGHVATGYLIDRNEAALGASGAVSAVLAAFAVLYPRHRVLVFAVLPLPAWIATLLFVGLDVWGVAAQSAGGGLPIGHGAHLAGAAFGLAYTLVKSRPRRVPPTVA